MAFTSLSLSCDSWLDILDSPVCSCSIDENVRLFLSAFGLKCYECKDKAVYDFPLKIPDSMKCNSKETSTILECPEDTKFCKYMKTSYNHPRDGPVKSYDLGCADKDFLAEKQKENPKKFACQNTGPSGGQEQYKINECIFKGDYSNRPAKSNKGLKEHKH